MLFTWLIAAFVAGAFVSTFFDEIMNWAKDVFNSLSASIKKAWVYIRRVPGAIQEFIRYILNGRMVDEPKPQVTSWEEVEEMYKNGDIDKKTYEELKEKHLKKIGELER